MRKIILLAVILFSVHPLFSQFVISAGYTSASVKFHDVLYFGDSLKIKNGGQELDIPQKQRGFNVGLGIAGAGNGTYMRTGLNFTKYGQKALSLADGSSLRLRSSATDAYLAAGALFGGDAGGALYVLFAATYTTGRLDLNGSWNGLEGTYKGHAVKFSYGIGAGLVLESGAGLTFDLYCNFSEKDSKQFLEKDGAKLPRDYSTYSANPTGYSGEYVRASNGYIRGQFTLHIPLGGK